MNKFNLTSFKDQLRADGAVFAGDLKSHASPTVKRGVMNTAQWDAEKYAIWAKNMEIATRPRMGSSD